MISWYVKVVVFFVWGGKWYFAGISWFYSRLSGFQILRYGHLLAELPCRWRS